MVELITAALAVALLYRFGLGLSFFVGFIFVSALIVVTFIDLDVRIVPDVISLPGIGLGLLFSITHGYLSAVAQAGLSTSRFSFIPSPLSSLTGVILGGGVLLAVAWAYEFATGKEGMGGGDVKLLAMIGAFLGWVAVPVTLFFASLSGSIIGLALILKEGADGKYALPFAPFLCAGALFHLFFSNEMIAMYLRFG